MADNQAAAAAGSLPPEVSKDKGKVSPLVVTVLVDDVGVKKPASSLSISPPLAIMPADNSNKNKTTTRTAPVAIPTLLIVCLWALINAVVFAIADVATLILDRNPCTKSTGLFRCVTLTDAAAAEVMLLLYGELSCSAVAALAAALRMLLTTRTTTTSRWGAVVDALAWVALAATAGIHCMEVVTDRILLAADSGDTFIFTDVVGGSVCLAVDLLAGFLLCSSPCRLELGEQQGDDDAEV